jgi:hypothetical protein
MKLKQHIFILFSLLATSCATVTVTSRTVPIDSEPRGIEIFDSKKKSVGNTPLLLNEPGRSAQDVYYKNARGDFRLVSNPCRIRFFRAFLGNAIVASIYPSFGLAAILYDFFASGDAYDCSRFPAFLAADHSMTGFDPCVKAMVWPPKMDDEFVSDMIAQRWIKESKALNSCVKYIDYDSTKVQFEYINVSNLTEKIPRKFGLAKVKDIAAELGASHVVHLKVFRDDSGYSVFPVMTDLLTEKDVPEVLMDTVLPFRTEDVVPEIADSKRKWLKSINMLPNSATFGARTFDLGHISTDSGRDVRILPTGEIANSYLRNLGITWVFHPKSYTLFDLDFNAYPALDAGYYQMESVVYQKSESALLELHRQDFSMTFVDGMYYLDLSTHTPLGTFGYSLGAGLGYFSAKYGSERSHDVFPTTNAGAYYVAFLSNNIFFYYNNYFTQVRVPGSRHFIENDDFYVDNFRSQFIGFGFYVPNVKGLLRRGLR